MQGVWKVHIQKEAYKFSSAHMTIFPDGSKEGLHGHNYSVEVTVELCDHSFYDMVDFSIFKRAIAGICQRLDEKILIPSDNPMILLNNSNGEQELRISDKRYVFPEDEVELLPVSNISVELLSRYFTEQLVQAFSETELDRDTVREKVRGLEVRINETSGQGASFAVRLEQPPDPSF